MTEKKDCSCKDDCECKKEEKNIQQVQAYPARDPNNNLVAVFEQNVKCDKCGELHFYQMIVDSGTIFKLAELFDNMIKKALSEKKTVTPGGNKTNSRIVIPGR